MIFVPDTGEDARTSRNMGMKVIASIVLIGLSEHWASHWTSRDKSNFLPEQYQRSKITFPFSRMWNVPLGKLII